MRNVIKYEWKLRKNLFGITCAVLFALNVISLILISGNDGFINFEGSVANFQLGWTFLIDTLGLAIFFLYVFLAPVSEMIHKDTAYLYKMLPVNGFELFGGKLIVSLIQVVALIIQMLFYGWIFVAVVGNANVIINDEAIQPLTGTFFENLGEVVNNVLGQYPTQFFTAIMLVIAGILMFAMTIVVAELIHAVFLKRMKGQKFLLVVVVMVVFYITGKIAGFIFEKGGMSSIDEFNLGVIWGSIAVLLLFSGAYYALSAWLYEKKLSV